MTDTTGTPSNLPGLATRHSLTLTPETSRARLAALDIVAGLFAWRLWWTMAWNDTKMRYRRSVLGPFWLTISMAISVGMLGFLYAKLFKIESQTYVPSLTLGLLAWGYVQGVVTDGCTSFMLSENFIKQIRLPFSTFIYRIICRNVIILGHNAIVYLVVAVVYRIVPTWNTLLLIPGFGLVLLTSVWVGLLLGMVCTRFRDFPQLVTSLLQVLFFVTPIMWVPEQLGQRAYFVQFNPGYHVVELIRAPLLGNAPREITWLYLAAMTAAGGLVTFFMFRHYRNRISFWL
ncbi:MAG: ABC transporter permease [SAR324 cluster bacterium]